MDFTSGEAARTALLAEVAREERSLPSVAASLTKLEADFEAMPAKKRARALQGDWKLVFASDEAAVAPFTTGSASGPFAVLEDVYLRLSSSDLQAIEVVRKVGPFGNAAQSLHGRWSVTAGGEGEGDVLSWRTMFMVNERSREVDPPKDMPTANEARVTHVSSELLVVRRADDASSYVIWTRFDKGELKKALDDASVESEMILTGA